MLMLPYFLELGLSLSLSPKRAHEKPFFLGMALALLALVQYAFLL